MAIETFKILNNMSPLVLSDLINLRENPKYTFRYRINYRHLKLELVRLVRRV